MPMWFEQNCKRFPLLDFVEIFPKEFSSRSRLARILRSRSSARGFLHDAYNSCVHSTPHTHMIITSKEEFKLPLGVSAVSNETYWAGEVNEKQTQTIPSCG